MSCFAYSPISFTNIQIFRAKSSLKMVTLWGVCAFVCLVLLFLTAKASMIGMHLIQTHSQLGVI